jgi:hypothetical protein
MGRLTDEQGSVIQHPFGAAHTVTTRLVQTPLDVFVEEDVAVGEDGDGDGLFDGSDFGPVCETL